MPAQSFPVGRCHCSFPRCGRAEKHVNGGYLTFGLNEDTADFIHPDRHVLRDFILRRYGISGKEPATSRNHAFNNRVVSVNQFLLSHRTPFYL